MYPMKEGQKSEKNLETFGKFSDIFFKLKKILKRKTKNEKREIDTVI